MIRKWLKRKMRAAWTDGYNQGLTYAKTDYEIKRTYSADQRRIEIRNGLEAVGDKSVAATIYHFMCDPSNREIAAALGIPKSTVHDAIKTMRDHRINQGLWSL